MDYAWLSDFGHFLASSEERFSAFVLPAHVGDATVAEEAFRVSVAGLPSCRILAEPSYTLSFAFCP